MDKTIVLILLTCVLIVVILFRRQSGYSETKEIPRIIWTYWNEDTIPPFINKCINNFRRMNPGWDVRIANINDVPEDLRSLSPQRQSDWVRLNKLKDNGGIWLDASIILTDSLEWIRTRQQLNQTEGFMYYSNRHTVNKDFPVIESWCIAAIPKSETIQKWFEEFDYACRKHGNNGIAYIEELDARFGKSMKTKLLANIDWPDYLTVYVSHQKVLQVDNLSSKLFSWDLDESGPYIYQYKSGWNSYKTINKLTEGPAPYTPKIIKLIGADRKFIRDDMKIHPDSIFGKYLE